MINLIFLCLTLLVHNSVINAQESSQTEKITKTSKVSKKKKKEILIDFSFNDENLTTIVNLLADKKGLNIILPQGPNAITQKITFNYPEPITLNKAWEFLLTFLTLSGYSLVVDETNVYSIVRTDPNVVREPMPLFISVKPENLPKTEQKIRYVYYLNNIRVPENSQVADPLNQMFKDILTPDGTFMYDPRSNAVIMSDNATNIASAMKIVVALDTTGYRETVEVIPLFYANAANIEKLFKELIPPTQDSRFPLRSGPKTESNIYFSSGTGVFAYGRLNRLVLMGKDTAVERIKDFITEYIDVAPESGKSILHYYDLQYLEAEEFAKVLQRIVTPVGGAQDQVIKEAGGGPERYFEGVIVLPEAAKPRREAEPVAGSKLAGEVQETATAQVYQGGNRLVIAARESDWLRIRDLIHKLDRPQPQVILEVLILDLTKETDDIIAGSNRNKAGLFDCGTTANYLASHVTDVNTVLGAPTPPNLPPPPSTLAADLLGRLGVATSLEQGSLIVSFNDSSGSGIYALLQIVKNNSNIKVLSHPFLVTTNNKKAFVESVTIRRDRGNAEGTPTGGTITIKEVDVEAKIQVTIVPRISSMDRLNLKIDVNIDDFVSSTDVLNFTRRTRNISTDSNLGSGDVLALGGLIQDVSTSIRTQTPILGRIPIIGWLFSKTEVLIAKSNLVVFICPTIIDPKIRSGLDRYTTDKIRQFDKDLGNNDILDNHRDPITHIFFNDSTENRSMINQYLNDAKNTNIKPQHFRKDIKKITKFRKTKTPEMCAVTSEIIPTEAPMPKKRIIPPTTALPTTLEEDNIKELLAMEENPFSGIKQVKS